MGDSGRADRRLTIPIAQRKVLQIWELREEAHSDVADIALIQFEGFEGCYFREVIRAFIADSVIAQIQLGEVGQIRYNLCTI